MSDALADFAERLMAEFEGQIGLDVVSRVVRDCVRDLAAVPVEALPELVERCARQRLTERAGGAAASPAGPPRGGRLPAAN